MKKINIKTSSSKKSSITSQEIKICNIFWVEVMFVDGVVNTSVEGMQNSERPQRRAEGHEEERTLFPANNHMS